MKVLERMDVSNLKVLCKMDQGYIGIPYLSKNIVLTNFPKYKVIMNYNTILYLKIDKQLITVYLLLENEKCKNVFMCSGKEEYINFDLHNQIIEYIYYVGSSKLSSRKFEIFIETSKYIDVLCSKVNVTTDENKIKYDLGRKQYYVSSEVDVIEVSSQKIKHHILEYIWNKNKDCFNMNNFDIPFECCDALKHIYNINA